MSPFGEIMLLASDGSGKSDRAARMAVEFSRNLGSETPSRTPCWSISPDGPSPLVSSIPNGRDLDLAPEQRPQTPNLVHFEAGGGLRGSCQTGMSSASSRTSFHAVQVREKQGHGLSTPPGPSLPSLPEGESRLRAGTRSCTSSRSLPHCRKGTAPTHRKCARRGRPSRKTVPNAPKQVCPPHDVYLLYDRRSLTSSRRPARVERAFWQSDLHGARQREAPLLSGAQVAPLFLRHARTSSTPDPPSIVWCSGQVFPSRLGHLAHQDYSEFLFRGLQRIMVTCGCSRL